MIVLLQPISLKGHLFEFKCKLLNKFAIFIIFLFQDGDIFLFALA
jgi:hypothetical protein